MKNTVVASGLGCVCAAGLSLDDAMASMYAGKRNPMPPAALRFDLDKTYPVFEIARPLEVPPEYISHDSVSRTVKLSLIALHQALRKSFLDIEKLRKYRVGVCIGTTVGCTLNNEPFYREFIHGRKPSMDAIDSYLKNNPAEYISRLVGNTVKSVSAVNACASGTDAVGIGMSWIKEGLCDIVIAGGADELSRITYLGFISLMISSTEACRPFDLKRSGLNLGEAAGILILESEEHAAKRGAEIFAKLCSYGTAADAYHPTKPHPEGRGLKNAIQKALTEANTDSGKIRMINAHGTATPDNDRTEGRVLHEIFGTSARVISTKAFTGHTLGAAGAIEAIFAIRALNDGRLPPEAGFIEKDPECFIEPSREIVDVDSEYALSTSLAFGGGNSALIFRRWRE